MQQQDLIALLNQLSGSLNDTSTSEEDVMQGLQTNIAPLLVSDIKQITSQSTNPAPSLPLAAIPTGQIDFFNTATPSAQNLLQLGPDVLRELGESTAIDPAAPAQPTPAWGSGASIVHLIDPNNASPNLAKWFIHFNFTEFISVFLSTDTVNPAILLSIDTGLFHLLNQTSFPITKGSIWILSKLLNASAPAGQYTGLTIGGGTISFSSTVQINNGALNMPAGAVCTVQLNLEQPVDTTVSPNNIGIDAMNAQVQLPTQFSFSFSTPTATITSVAPASWKLYGSANTFEYDPSQNSFFNAALNSILLPCKVISSAFAVSNCASPFFTIQGTAPIVDGFWELPTQTVNVAQPGTASGIGALAVLCTAGLQVTWNGLNGGPINLQAPYISAGPGIIGITDFFANNLYAVQNYNLWSNEKTGHLSTLTTRYSSQFALYYVSMQFGEEFIGSVVNYIANVDRPVRVDGSPIALQGFAGLLYQKYTSNGNHIYFYDPNLIAENYTPANGNPVAKVPQEAMALKNALLTITPASGILLIGTLETVDTFKNASLYLSFGLFYLVPSLPDPYASTFVNPLPDRYSESGLPGVASTLPLSEVTDLLLGLVRWPVVTTPPSVPPAQPAMVAFAMLPLNNSGGGIILNSNSAAVTPSDTPSEITAGQRKPDGNLVAWDRTVDFSFFNLAMLDVSTNADLMGVSFSTMNIEARAEDGDVYTIKSVNSAADTNIIQIQGMNLVAPGKFVRAFTVPEITWEPTYNLTTPQNTTEDPPMGWLLFGNDGGPTQIFNNSPDLVPIAPIKVSKFIVDTYKKSRYLKAPLVTASVFTLPFGLRSFALFNNKAPFPDTGYIPAKLEIEPQDYNVTQTGVNNAPQKIVRGGLQIIAKGKNDPQQKSGASFEGFTLQLRNLLDQSGNPTNTSILGFDVDTIFNGQFFKPLGLPQLTVNIIGVPLGRIDFSGYGASTFSNWIDPDASIAATSQAKFDVFVGRTSLEVIQVKSLVYPWGIRVVRTITMYRAGSAVIYRTDSGWRAETNGVYDFSYKDSSGASIPNPYEFFPGVVKGVFDVKNIVENDLPIFTKQWFREPGTKYIDPQSQKQVPVPGTGVPEVVQLQPVYFDADVQIDNITQGGTNGKVPSKKMLGYVQLSPRGEPISPTIFSELLATQSGSLGGPVDCIVNIAKSGQQMRLHSVDVSNSIDAAGTTPVFAGTARGTVILPKDGSWSIVQHSQATNAVSAIDNNAAVPLVREGQLKPDGTSDYPLLKIRLANPMDLLKAPDAATINYGLLQNTGTQKVLFQLPAYKPGKLQLLSKDNEFPLAKFADAYHLVNSTGIFPLTSDVPDMDMTKYGISILQEGYKLINNANLGQALTQSLTSPWYFVNTPEVKLYIVYNSGAPNLNFNLDSAAEQWESSAKNITLNVDLGPFKKLVYITGDFDSNNGSDTSFKVPQMQFGPDLNPIVQILEVLQDLSGGNYSDAMKIAMGNSGDNYQYKFHADKEIPTVQFPSPEEDSPDTPLRLSASLKVGAYFNEALSITSDPDSLIPSAGAYLEFDGNLQVMCFSVGVGTIYAIGQVTLKLSADTVTGPSLYMKFGFGVELMVGLPVVGNASVTLMTGVGITLTSSQLSITAFVSFKGNADLLGGLVNITIYIEASGTLNLRVPPASPTSLTAEVTFAIDISIFLIIDIDFSKSWSATKQIS